MASYYTNEFVHSTLQICHLITHVLLILFYILAYNKWYFVVINELVENNVYMLIQIEQRM